MAITKFSCVINFLQGIFDTAWYYCEKTGHCKSVQLHWGAFNNSDKIITWFIVFYSLLNTASWLEVLLFSVKEKMLSWNVWIVPRIFHSKGSNGIRNLSRFYMLKCALNTKPHSLYWSSISEFCHHLLTTICFKLLTTLRVSKIGHWQTALLHRKETIHKTKKVTKAGDLGIHAYKSGGNKKITET